MTIRPLKGRLAYQDAVLNGRRYTSGPAIVTIVTAPPGVSENVLNVAVIVGKKVCPKSVVRSRIRRLLRQAVRSFVLSNSDRISERNLETIVIRWRSATNSPSEIHLSAVEHHVVRAISKALDLATNEGARP